MGEAIAEVGYLAGLCGHDGADWLKTLIDAAGHLQVDVVASGTVTVQSPGGDKIFALESIVNEGGTDLNATTGSNIKTSTAVPTGKVRVVTNLCVLNDTSAIIRVGAYYTINDTLYMIGFKASPAAKESWDWSGQLFLPAKATLTWQWAGCVAGDDLYWEMSGYEMDTP